MKRVATVRGLVRGRMLFTASFGLEDQAIAHAMFTQALEIEVVTLDTGRLFPETYELWAQTERRYGPCIAAFCPDRLSVESLVVRQGIDGFYSSIEARRACCVCCIFSTGRARPSWMSLACPPGGTSASSECSAPLGSLSRRRLACACRFASSRDAHSPTPPSNTKR
jgi:Phosphoadenosine phosphosulfate reductase family